MQFKTTNSHKDHNSPHSLREGASLFFNGSSALLQAMASSAAGIARQLSFYEV
jgi:hypothetical protein